LPQVVEGEILNHSPLVLGGLSLERAEPRVDALFRQTLVALREKHKGKTVAKPTFASEQIRHQAQENALAFLLASVVYFKEQGRSADQFMAVVGTTLAPGWKNLKGDGAQVVMDTLALHIVSLGGTLLARAGNDALAHATFAHVPSSDVLKFFGLSSNDADAIRSSSRLLPLSHSGTRGPANTMR
jgi:hypothetical protein